MKRFWTGLLCLCMVVCVCACRPTSAPQPFSEQAAKAALVALAEPTTLTAVKERRLLPEDTTLIRDWGDMGYLLSGTAPNGQTCYGIWRDGNWMLPCRYTALNRSGAFFLGQYYDTDGAYWEVYDKDGQMMAGTEEGATLTGLNADYFVLATQSNAQLFVRNTASSSDDDGALLAVACLPEGALTPATSAAICGDYILTVGGQGEYCIWQLYTSALGVTPYLRRRFSSAEGRYTVAYTGQRFLVTLLQEGSAKQYTYIEPQDGQSVYMRQQSWWYDADTDRLATVSLPYVVLSVMGAYTPGYTEQYAQSLHLAEGYSAVCVAQCNEYGVHVDKRYYVMDADANLVVRYPAGISPTALVFRGECGFVAAASEDAQLYNWQCNLLWQKSSAYAYVTKSWQSGRLVASYRQDGRTYYGAFDQNGKIAVPFEWRYLAPFVEGRSVAHDGATYWQVDAAGTTLAQADVACDSFWLAYGVYAFVQNGLYGLKNLRGEVVEPAVWQRIDNIGLTSENRVYVVCYGEDGSMQLILR